MAAYYNENDAFAAAWLRELIRAGMIAPGDVDERSISDVRADDVAGYDQCHWFAGIGVWSYALRLAGWPDKRPVWTGSCPCQPWSAAGKRLGFGDRRHLWPEFFRLIQKRRPVVVFGEQVGGKGGLAWIDPVLDDLEADGYTCGAVDFPACGVGAPHIRQRLYWCAIAPMLWDGGGDGTTLWLGDACGMADSLRTGWPERRSDAGSGQASGRGGIVRLGDSDRQQRHGAGLPGPGGRGELAEHGGPVRLADPEGAGRAYGGSGQALAFAGEGSGTFRGLGLADGDGREAGQGDDPPVGHRDSPAATGGPCRLEHPGGVGRERRQAPAPGHDHDGQTPVRPQDQHGAGEPDTHRIFGRLPGPTDGHWRDADWLRCRDGKWRPVEPGSFPLVDGAAARVGRLRGYGNAIVAPQAAEFIKTVMEAI